MGAGAGARMRPFVTAVDDQAVECSDADVAGDVPGGDVEAGSIQPLDHLHTVVIVHRAEIEAGRSPPSRMQVIPDAGGIALDHLTDRVVDRLEQMVARCEAVGTGEKAAAASRLGQGVVAVHDLVGQPDRRHRDQVFALDPQEPQIRPETTVRDSWERIDIDDRMAFLQALQAGEPQGAIDPFGVVALD